MFSYCRSNPASRKDASGTDDVCATDFNQDNNHANDLGNPTGVGGGSTGTAQTSSGGGRPSGGGSGTANSGQSNGGTNSVGRTEIHHIVEQCQAQKSGFSQSQIQADSNKVELSYTDHRAISGYYSSKQYYTNGMRVRDWLAGYSFEIQTQFGWYVVEMCLAR